MHTFNREAFDRAHEKYVAHLDQFSDQFGSDLWLYFRGDFFHDGDLKGLKLSKDFSSLVCTISATNIKWFDQEGDYNFEPSIDYQCTFKGIIEFSISDRTFPESKSRRCPHPTFMYGEINTLLGKVPSKLRSKYSSLIVELMGANNLIWMRIIFSEVKVTPVNPQEVELLENDPNVQIPLFLPHA